MESLQRRLNTLASTTGLSTQAAANVLGGTTNKSTQAALNAYAGTTGLSGQAALNSKAGTFGLSSQEAANAIPTYIAYYPESNWSGDATLYGGGTYVDFGNTFTLASFAVIHGVKFYVKKTGAPTGEMIAGLWSTTGAAGQQVPLASLAESAAYDPDTILTTTSQIIDFRFQTPYSASAGVYAVALYFADGDASNLVNIGGDATSPTFTGGHRVGSADNINWVYSTGVDCIFYIY